jgi:hypothetical protein
MCPVLLALLVSSGPVVAETPADAIQLQGDQLAWKPAPNMPAGVQIAVLEGSPREAGIFTIRLRCPAGTRLEAHWHPRPERVTVISGTIGVGFGDFYDQTKMTVFHAGDYYVNPPKSHHYVGFPQDGVVQVTGEGPWELHFLEKKP